MWSQLFIKTFWYSGMEEQLTVERIKLITAGTFWKNTWFTFSIHDKIIEPQHPSSNCSYFNFLLIKDVIVVTKIEAYPSDTNSTWQSTNSWLRLHMFEEITLTSTVERIGVLLIVCLSFFLFEPWRCQFSFDLWVWRSLM